MTELKPCPFCGGKAVFGAVENQYYIRCGNICDVRPTTGLKKYYGSLEEAANVWNKRHENSN